MSLLRQRSTTPSASAPTKIAASASGTTAVSATTSNAEAPPTTTTSQRTKFGFSEIANMFIRMRRHQSRASLASLARKQNEESSPSPAPAPAPEESSPPAETFAQALPGPHPTDESGRLILTPPISPSRSRVRRLTGELARSPYARRRTSSKPKPHHLVSSSGNAPITQPGVRDSILAEARRIPVTYNDVFEVSGGVNTATLLRATKKTILETIDGMGLGVNALAEEHWDCVICGPKKQTFKVQINYSATAVCCTRPDACKPVALDRAQSVPGLMSITKRNAL